MKRRLKFLLLALLVGLIWVTGLVVYGLYTMEIEDHYGDLQEQYYDSKSGDIIVNRTTSEFGIIEKNWKRINVRTQKTDSIDLYNWVNENDIEIYRPEKSGINYNNKTFTELIKLINDSKLKLVSKN